VKYDSPKPGWLSGLGELVRSYRMYVSLSASAFAKEIGIPENALSAIERNHRDLPESVLGSIEALVERFDQEVKELVDVSLKDIGDEDMTLEIKVSKEPEDAWARAVTGRAAVHTDGAVIPVL
jgi:transcriptional regulator with XRE-family HTH domain